MGSEKKFLLILIVITFFLRGATVFVDLHRFDPDPDQYKSLAENLRYNGVLGYGKTPTAFRPPLYPIALREVFRLTPSADRSLSESGLRGGTVPPFSLLISQNASIALFHWILGILTVLVVYRLAILLTFPPRWAFCVGLLTAIDPI